MLISKEEFINIINRLKNTDEAVDQVNNIFSRISDCMNASSLMICHEDIVVKLLEKIFHDKDTISWWLYEKNYGKTFEVGDFAVNGRNIDLTTAGKLYDYLVKELQEGNYESI